MKKNQDLPLIYACSGCSNIAQLANEMAVELDREHFAEMSCIAGVGGDVKPLVKKAHSGQKIIALDGCPLQCVKNTLARHQLQPTWHFTLTEFNVKKRYHTDCSIKDHNRIKAIITATIKQANAL